MRVCLYKGLNDKLNFNQKCISLLVFFVLFFIVSLYLAHFLYFSLTWFGFAVSDEDQTIPQS